MLKPSVLALAGMLVASSSATAAVDVAGAERLRMALERFFGGPGPADKQAVIVEAAGESYRVSINPEPLLEPLERLGIEITVSEVSFSVAPQPDGTWRVGGWPKSLSLSYEAFGDRGAQRLDGIVSEGIFDPQLRLFTSLNQTIQAQTGTSDGSGGSSDSRQTELRLESTAVPRGDGFADVELRQTTGPAIAENEFGLSDQPGGTQLRFSYGNQRTHGELRVTALRSKAMSELWAFLALHSDLDRLEAHQRDLKTLLGSLFPVFDRMEGRGTVEEIAVDADFGSFGADRIDWTLLLNGFVPDGRVSSRMEVSGISVPPGIVPVWANGLIPTGFHYDLSASGYDLARPIRELIGSLDLSREAPLDPAAVQSAFQFAVSEEGLTVTLGASRVASSLVNIDLRGRMSVTGPTAMGRIDIRATGMEPALDSIKTAGSSDPRAAQVLAALSLAKARGRLEGDGSMAWAIETHRDGSVTVNDQLVRPPNPERSAE